MSSDSNISALVITFNEKGYIEKCLDAIDFADEIIVVDSNSTDGTFEYLKNRPGITVIQHPFENYTKQKSYALEQASNDWVLFLDADEVVTKNLKEEILERVSTPTPHVAFWFFRQFMFKNEKLRYSGWQTDKNHRLFRKSKVRFKAEKLVHETLEVDGSSGYFKEKLIHYCYKNYEDYKFKMMQYGRMKAEEATMRQEKFSYLALVFKPCWKFVYHYFLRLGVLDGKKGLIICYLNALSDLENYRELKKIAKK